MTALISRWRFVPLILALTLAGVASVAYSLGASSGGSNSAVAAQGTTIPGHPELGSGWIGAGSGGMPGMAGMPGMRGAVGQVDVTITKIDGTKLALQTGDGWARTIDTAGATITRAGKTLAVTDLQVGDKITFRETRQSDGTYKINSIQVVVPTASGTVTAVTSGTVTINQPGGASKTLTLTGSTTYTRGGSAVTQSALVVGVRIVAQGTVDSAGHFTAAAVTIADSTVSGTVASKSTTAIVITTAPGKTTTVNVTAATKYVVIGVSAATLADIAVGARVTATGTLNTDGSLDATRVQAGFGGPFKPGAVGSGIPGGPGRGRWPMGGNGSASPIPGTGSNT
jgi:hypothetical protein